MPAPPQIPLTRTRSHSPYVPCRWLNALWFGIPFYLPRIFFALLWYKYLRTRPVIEEVSTAFKESNLDESEGQVSSSLTPCRSTLENKCKVLIPYRLDPDLGSKTRFRWRKVHPDPRTVRLTSVTRPPSTASECVLWLWQPRFSSAKDTSPCPRVSGLSGTDGP